MQNYSSNPGSVRVDFFKESGKWYATEAVDMGPYYNMDFLHDAFARALWTHLEGRLDGMLAVCLQPYHKHSHPIMLRVDSTYKGKQ